MNSRSVAARIITGLLLNKTSLAKALPHHLSPIENNHNKAFIKELCFGVSRWYVRLDFLAKDLLKKPLKKKDFDVYALILIGIYQLLYMRVPQHAAVSETVNAARELKKEWAINLINAVLRQFLRKKDKLLSLADKDPLIKYAHPEWLLKRIKKEWPTEWQEILTENNQHSPLSLRVNQRMITRKDYLKKLADLGIQGVESLYVPFGIMLEKACQVSKLPDFSNGEVSVQDCGAQFAAQILDLNANCRILDACAAPGGKTMHILETQPDLGAVVAVDNDKDRLQMVSDNIKRLNFPVNIELICADVRQTQDWWNGQLFDRILLDAPCSATGVIRRHPDIKLLRKESDIKAMAQKQLQLLKMLWPLLKPDGKLVYVTCSILPEENEQVIEQFLQTHSDICEEKINAQWGIAKKFGRQILPGQDNMDGFYYACFLKKESG